MGGVEYLPTPQKQSKYCIFLDYTYEMLEKDVDEFDEENLFRRYTPCGKKYIYCLYSYLVDMGLFNLLDLFELKCKSIYSTNMLELLVRDYLDGITQCPITPQMRQLVLFQSTEKLLTQVELMVNVLLTRFKYRENLPIQTMLKRMLEDINTIQHQNFI